MDFPGVATLEGKIADDLFPVEKLKQEFSTDAGFNVIGIIGF